MGKSNLITTLNTVTIYNSLLKGCTVNFEPFTTERPVNIKKRSQEVFVSILSVKGLHVSKSGKSICCKVEYSDYTNEINTAKLYVAFNDDKTSLILHSNNNIWGTIPADYKYITNPY